jgi:ABC-type uncharacterized transport system ATPase subunit
MSSVLDIRRITSGARNAISGIDDEGCSETVDKLRTTAHERLRGNHISMMEQLQALSDENESLLRELSVLKDRQQNGGKCEAPVGSESELQVADTSPLFNKIDAQDREIKALRTKLAEAEDRVKDMKRQELQRRQEESELKKKVRPT